MKDKINHIALLITNAPTKYKDENKRKSYVKLLQQRLDAYMILQDAIDRKLDCQTNNQAIQNRIEALVYHEKVDKDMLLLLIHIGFTYVGRK